MVLGIQPNIVLEKTNITQHVPDFMLVSIIQIIIFIICYGYRAFW